MRYTHSAVGLKRLSLPLACWELGFVLRVAPLPAFLLLLAGHAEAVSVIRVTQSAPSGAGGGARGAEPTRNQETLRIVTAKLPAVR
jgi:hypothetical protein